MNYITKKSSTFATWVKLRFIQEKTNKSFCGRFLSARNIIEY